MLMCLRSAVGALAVVGVASSGSLALPSHDARWIWGAWVDAVDRPAGEVCYFQRSIELDASVRKAVIQIACDNHFDLWVNGMAAGRGDAWEWAATLDIGRHLRVGRNLVAVRGLNDGGPAGLIAALDVELADGRQLNVVTDASWSTAADERPDFRERPWTGEEGAPAHVFAVGEVSGWSRLQWDSDRHFEAPAGFWVQSAAGPVPSLVSMTFAGDGQLFAAQENGPIWRFTDADGDGTFELGEPYSGVVKGCHGLCWFQGELLGLGAGPDGMGMYRFDRETRQPELVGRFDGSGEHGPHAIVPGPDGALYVVAGNHTVFGGEFSASSPFQIHGEGALLPRYLGGHADEIRSPGGFVARRDGATGSWSLHAAGLRNAYDLAFHPDGALFTVDSDMEWDIGLPWYRPVMVDHVVPGGDHGWRTGSSKWPTYSADVVPPVAEIGQGSPTGLVCYAGDAYPSRYRGVLFSGDWSRGEILALRLERHGVSYRGHKEVFLRGRPLNVTDLAIDAAGELVFVTGGRESRGGIFRVRHAGSPSDRLAGASEAGNPGPSTDLRPLEERALIDRLGSDDRMLAYLAARELERRPQGSWQQRVLEARDPRAAARGLLALARLHWSGRAEGPFPLEAVVERLDPAADEETLLALLRSLQLVCIEARENGRTVDGALLGPRLLALFPAAQRSVNRELAVLLADQEPEGACAALCDRLQNEPSREEQIHLAYCLRVMRRGWSPERLEVIHQWLGKVRSWTAGVSFGLYLEQIEEDFLRLLEPAERERWEAERLAAQQPGAASPPRFTTRSVRDHDQTLRFLQQALEQPRDLGEGARVFTESCARCHRKGSIGSVVGPDLSALAQRFALPEILDATLDPSRSVPEQYQATNLFLADGDVISGLVVREEEHEYTLLLASGEQHKVAKERVKRQRPSIVSLMPAGLLDQLTRLESADLMAFLLAPDEVSAAPSSWVAVDTDGLAAGQVPAEPRDWWLEGHEDEGLRVEFEVQVQAGVGEWIFRADPEDPARTGYRVRLGGDAWGQVVAPDRGAPLGVVAYETWRGLVYAGDWNHVEVRAAGPRLEVLLGGIPVLVCFDPRFTGGSAGFHLPAGARLAVRHLRVQGLSPRSGR